MLKPTVEFFYEDNINKIIQECLTYPLCKIIIAVESSKISAITQVFLEQIDPKILAQQPKISAFNAQIIFTNGANLTIIRNSEQSLGYRASKIYCSPNTSIEVYFCILQPQLFDYQKFMEMQNEIQTNN